MHLFYIIALAGLAASSPTSPKVPGPSFVLDGTSAPADNQTLTPQEAHENALKYVQADRIVESASLYTYLKSNLGSNHTIYVSDQQKFVDLSSVYLKPSSGENGTKHKRQGEEDPCFGYNNYWSEQTQTWFNSWQPVSGCQYTGLDPNGGTFSLNWGSSISITETFGLDWGIIEDILSASIGFSVTETWSNGGAAACNIPGNSVGQIWDQNRIVWGWVWQEGCESCDYGGGCGGQFGSSTALGGAEAPAASYTEGTGWNIGCSTGYANVQC
jgi:hypothetical protein